MTDKTPISPKDAELQEEAIRKIMAERGVTFEKAYNIYLKERDDSQTSFHFS